MATEQQTDIWKQRALNYERFFRLHQFMEYTNELRRRNEQLEWTRPRRTPGKPGAPGQWKGDLGGKLLEDVEAVRKEKGADISIAAAIGALRQSSPIWRGYKKRELEVRYQDAKKFWAPWIEQDRILDVEMEKWRRMGTELQNGVEVELLPALTASEDK